MVINLNDGYFIDIDEMNHTLKKTCISDKTGKEYDKTYGYFNDIRQAVSRYLQLEQISMCDGVAVDLIKYVDLIEQINNKILDELTENLSKVQGAVQGGSR